ITDDLLSAWLTQARCILSRRFRGIDMCIVDQAIEDAILLCVSPSGRYDASRATRITYICHVASRDILDTLRKDSRRRRIENAAAIERSMVVGHPIDLDTSTIRQERLRLLLRAAAVGTERRFAKALVSGAGKTELEEILRTSPEATTKPSVTIRLLTER